MKSQTDLKALLPILIERFSRVNHTLGESYEDMNDYESNCFTYEEDGWYVEINYECCGEYQIDPGDYWTGPSYDLIRAWGEVTEIIVSHYDEENDDEREFTEDELEEFYAAFNEELKEIA